MILSWRENERERKRTKDALKKYVSKTPFNSASLNHRKNIVDLEEVVNKVVLF